MGRRGMDRPPGLRALPSRPTWNPRIRVRTLTRSKPRRRLRVSATMSPPLPHLLTIAGGAVLGAWFRWGLALALNRPGWPWGTLVANLVGGVLAGVAWGWMDGHPSAVTWMRPLVMVGFLGALTTFSTFSLETVLLLQEGQVARAMTFAASNLVGSLALTSLGLWLA